MTLYPGRTEYERCTRLCRFLGDRGVFFSDWCLALFNMKVCSLHPSQNCEKGRVQNERENIIRRLQRSRSAVKEVYDEMFISGVIKYP